MDNTNESKAERFVRLAEPRVSREYTEKQVEAMFDAMQQELNTQKAKFTKVTDRNFRF